MEGEIKVIVPTSEHIAELEAKGINIEDELTRLVYDHYANLKEDKHLSSVTMKIPKEQLDTINKLGVNGPKEIAEEFRDTLHAILTARKEKSEV